MEADAEAKAFKEYHEWCDAQTPGTRAPMAVNDATGRCAAAAVRFRIHARMLQPRLRGRGVNVTMEVFDALNDEARALVVDE